MIPLLSASRVVMAPMAGVTDRPFRDLCRRHGARLMISEMITSDMRLWHTRKSDKRLQVQDEAGPRWIQIAGSEPGMMAEAAVRCVDLGAEIIDINMGCPAKKVCNKAAGSALLRNEDLVGSILTAVVEAISVPVTLKIRLGWSRQEMNGWRIGEIAEDAGISLLTVHGRTRAERFSGKVDYEEIANIKSRLTIPVLANGDITTPAQARKILETTGADGVMIGRAAQGRPWLPGIISHYLETGELRTEPSAGEIWATLREHVVELSDFYGEDAGVRIARKHVGWYLQTLGDGSGFRQAFNGIDRLDGQLAMIDQHEELAAEAA